MQSTGQAEPARAPEAVARNSALQGKRGPGRPPLTDLTNVDVTRLTRITNHFSSQRSTEEEGEVFHDAMDIDKMEARGKKRKPGQENERSDAEYSTIANSL
jgi:hypothetical protein